jgi:hypothetical protein
VQAYLHSPAVSIMPPNSSHDQSAFTHNYHKIVIQVDHVSAKIRKFSLNYAFTLRSYGMWQRVVLSVGTSASEKRAPSTCRVEINK